MFAPVNTSWKGMVQERRMQVALRLRQQGKLFPNFCRYDFPLYGISLTRPSISLLNIDWKYRSVYPQDPRRKTKTNNWSSTLLSLTVLGLSRHSIAQNTFAQNLEHIQRRRSGSNLRVLLTLNEIMELDAWSSLHLNTPVTLGRQK